MTKIPSVHFNVKGKQQ